MTDIVSPEKRSIMMSGIRSKNTGLEVLLRSGLHRAGFRFRLHVKGMPGTPDIILPRHGAVVQANGCFWHGHDCALFKMPATNRDRWAEKIAGNRERDERNLKLLLGEGWRVLDVWECALRGPGSMATSELIDRVCSWVESGPASLELRSTEIS